MQGFQGKAFHWRAWPCMQQARAGPVAACPARMNCSCQWPVAQLESSLIFTDKTLARHLWSASASGGTSLEHSRVVHPDESAMAGL